MTASLLWKVFSLLTAIWHIILRSFIVALFSFIKMALPASSLLSRCHPLCLSQDRKIKMFCLYSHCKLHLMAWCLVGSVFFFSYPLLMWGIRLDSGCNGEQILEKYGRSSYAEYAANRNIGVYWLVFLKSPLVECCLFQPEPKNSNSREILMAKLSWSSAFIDHWWGCR